MVCLDKLHSISYGKKKDYFENTLKWMIAADVFPPDITISYIDIVIIVLQNLMQNDKMAEYEQLRYIIDNIIMNY